MAAISIRKLTKSYANGYQAVKGIDLEITDHEFMVFVGPSGCGKTTTLRMIAGLEDISCGEIHIGDRVVNSVAPKDRDIAMVFQSYALYPHMTVFDNMAFALRLRKEPEAGIRTKIQLAAELLSLGNQLAKLPKQLSGGQRQRVALGRAIVRQPQAFLFDEPLSNLDAKLRGEMRQELRALADRLQTTAVYVTHDQIEAMTLGDRITVMSVGEIQQVGTPRQIYDHPANRFVAGFIGTPPMNFLPGTLARNPDGWHFTLGDGQCIPLRPAHPARLGEADPQCVIGIRPEHLSLVAPDTADHAQLAMRVSATEYMGDHTYIHLRCGATTSAVTLRGPAGSRVERGDLMRVFLDLRSVHVFRHQESTAECLTNPTDLAAGCW
jgi:multiple sugar transport system ATP-binding protein